MRQKAAGLLLLLCIFSAPGLMGVLCADRQPAALGYTGIYNLRDLHPNLTGEGVRIGAICRSLTYIAGQPQDDFRINIDHTCFSGGNITIMDGLAVTGDTSDHSTAIGAILVGRDEYGWHRALGDFQFEGASPGAQLDVYEFWRFVRNKIQFGEPLNADILTMSLGITFEEWWTRGIDRLAESNGLIIIASAGNGSNVCDPLLYPAAGANVIAVGVINSDQTGGFAEGLSEFSLAYPTNSSSGPTSDGRTKPDITAPGNMIVPDPNSVTGYHATGDWSSFATPIVSGTAALLVQAAREHEELSEAIAPEGGNCVIKAVLLNSAMKMPFWHKGGASKLDDHKTPLDEIQGAGLLDAAAAYEQLAARRIESDNADSAGWDNNVIERSGDIKVEYPVKITDPNEQYIAATLTWNKHYQDAYPFNAIESAQSNLRLEVWAVDLDDPSKDYLIDYSDSDIDNVEHVYCKIDPDFSDYQIVVSCDKVSLQDMRSTGLNERYGLAWRTAATKWTEHPWWDDLNGDGVKDYVDGLVYTVFEGHLPMLDEPAITGEVLKLSEERIELLREHFDEWKHFTSFAN